MNEERAIVCAHELNQFLIHTGDLTTLELKWLATRLIKISSLEPNPENKVFYRSALALIDAKVDGSLK